MKPHLHSDTITISTMAEDQFMGTLLLSFHDMIYRNRLEMREKARRAIELLPLHIRQCTIVHVL